MYQYSTADQTLVNERVEQFRDQMTRFLEGKIPPAEFLPLRLQNGLYVQRHAPMLRISIPYGMISSQQMRTLAHISDHYDKGYGHFSTRQNIQFNWIPLPMIPDVLAKLAEVQMHAIQTSGNCIRNTTTDELAGVIADEVEDPRPYCEIIRQWSTFHPEFAFLPRKFKIAVNACTTTDRAAVQVHDIGIELVRNAQGQLGFRMIVGGGLGRTPLVGHCIRDFLPEEDLLSYLDAILQVYNRYGRRDNKYKARIKILVKALGPDVFAEKVEQAWALIKQNDELRLTPDHIANIKNRFSTPDYKGLQEQNSLIETWITHEPGFRFWYQKNTFEHKISGYRVVVVPLKHPGVPPGDIDTQQMLALADMADTYSFGELRSTHQQNLVLADCEQTQLLEIFHKLKALRLATPTINTLQDIICCPGGDYCALANAKSIPIAEDIQRRFDDLDYLYDIGDLDLNISGCMNACGHHHVGHIGILGVDKKGQEFYQISIGGSSRQDASIGEILGPSFEQNQVTDVIEQLITHYKDIRVNGESFLETYRRVGVTSFKQAVYGESA
jgi:sulfite reductase (NADPH) hemoprotein beta-component